MADENNSNGGRRGFTLRGVEVQNAPDPVLSEEAKRQIEVEARKYPPERRRSCIMSALRIAQDEKGWLSTDVIDSVCEYVGVHPIVGYEIATFYNMYYIVPVGKYKLSICTNLPCALMGGIDAADYLKKKLGVGFGETTKDGKFTLVESECLGACCEAPVYLLNEHKMCCKMSKEEIDRQLAELK